MHDGMQYDLIRGQGHEPMKVRNSTIFKGYLLPIYNGGWQMRPLAGAAHSPNQG